MFSIKRFAHSIRTVNTRLNYFCYKHLSQFTFPVSYICAADSSILKLLLDLFSNLIIKLFFFLLAVKCAYVNKSHF